MRIPGSNASGPGIRTAAKNTSLVSNPMGEVAKFGALVKKGEDQYRSQRDHDDLMDAKNKLNDQIKTFKMEELAKEGEDARGTSERYNESY